MTTVLEELEIKEPTPSLAPSQYEVRDSIIYGLFIVEIFGSDCAFILTVKSYCSYSFICIFTTFIFLFARHLI